MSRQPKDLITWEELERRQPREEITEVQEVEAEPVPLPLSPGAFRKRHKPAQA